MSAYADSEKGAKSLRSERAFSIGVENEEEAEWAEASLEVHELECRGMRCKSYQRSM